jgi:nucleoside-diphosphate-sugar epimerase
MQAPPGMIKATAALTGLLEKLGLPIPEQYTAEYLREIAGVTYLGTNAKARRELGYEPRPLREGLRQTLEHEMRGA